jgi:hypothetical protein
VTLDELDASYRPEETIAEGCVRHGAYWDHRCKKGTKGCGIHHKDIQTSPQRVEELREKFAKAKQRVADREALALEGQCAHCDGKMRELHAVLRLPGIRYFVCQFNAAHSVVIMPEDLKK